VSYCNTSRRRVQTFNALVGVYLQSVPAELCGNLVVFPGSHTLVAEATRDASTMDLLRREGTSSSPLFYNRQLLMFSSGMAALHEKLPYLSQPLQITADAGDVLVAHSSLPHSVAPNVSSCIRYALYFRVNSTSRCCAAAAAAARD
jgi:ectoine hydroxylase-related dioxygenase (phytanoyl-CoA dioxygenase family)